MRQRPAIPVFAFYERLLMRLLFAWLVWRATPHVLIVNGIPSPNGITRLFDLHFLLDPHVFRVADLALAAALIFYVLRFVVWLALPVALFVNLAANGIENSQGAIQHAARQALQAHQAAAGVDWLPITVTATAPVVSRPPS